MRWTRDGLVVTAERDAIDLDFVEAELRQAYWAADRSRADIAASLERSVTFALLDDGRQIGFARAVTDAVTVAWIADVVVTADRRGRGLGKWLIECVLSHPDVAGARRKLLLTDDAHGLYARYGFEVAQCMTADGRGAG